MSAAQSDSYHVILRCPTDGVQDATLAYLRGNEIPCTPMPKMENRAKFGSKGEVEAFIANTLGQIEDALARKNVELGEIKQRHEAELKKKREEIEAQLATQTYIISKRGYTALVGVNWQDFKRTTIKNNNVYCIKVGGHERDRAFKILEENGQFCTCLRPDVVNEASLTALIDDERIVKGPAISTPFSPSSGKPAARPSASHSASPSSPAPKQKPQIELFAPLAVNGQKIDYKELAEIMRIPMFVTDTRDGKSVFVQINRTDLKTFSDKMDQYKYPYCPKDTVDGYTDTRFRKILQFQ